MSSPLSPDLLPHLASLWTSSPLLVSLFDPGDTLRYANPAFRQAYGLSADEEPSWPELMRRNFANLSRMVEPGDDVETWLTSTIARRGKLPYRQIEVHLGSGRWIMMTETIDAAHWALNIGVDISDLKIDHRTLRSDRDRALRASTVDTLTGLSNRRHIESVLENYIARPHLLGCCVAMLDIDHFKRINDTHGHPFGDQVLRNFAKLLQCFLRRSDGIGRFGGEEFMLILPGSNITEAAILINRLLDALRQQQGIAEVGDFTYTCSVGLTELGPDDTAQSIYQRADAALYAAKQGGRDRMEIL
ncbi:MAG: sensor domain-containing diguanylate cyclase [Rhodocyclales bacterium GT-UBC]|nr:MAG: sensor domain-containing diguanylate cyclase [Rhodocyclales bacterium GT-UBC]